MGGLVDFIVRWLASAAGVFALAALDASFVFYLPLAIDVAVVVAAARTPELAWLYPVLATAGSCAGGSFTFWVGERLGDQGLERLVPGDRLDRTRRAVRGRGGAALALPALIPPPFPFTAFVLAAGALDVGFKRFLLVMGGVRIVRFGAEAALATLYGTSILSWMESDGFRIMIFALAAVAIAGTAVGLTRAVRARAGTTSETG